MVFTASLVGWAELWGSEDGIDSPIPAVSKRPGPIAGTSKPQFDLA